MREFVEKLFRTGGGKEKYLRPTASGPLRDFYSHRRHQFREARQL